VKAIKRTSEKQILIMPNKKSYLIPYEILQNYLKGEGDIKMNIKSDEDLIKLARIIVHKEAEYSAENPTESDILVLVVEPFKEPYKLMIPNDLRVFNSLVSGFIEMVTIDYNPEKNRSISIVLNEEGKLLNLPFNRHIINLDTIVGTFLIVAFNAFGNTVSLTEEEAAYYIKRFRSIEVYL
jgi:hypothetical protein